MAGYLVRAISQWTNDTCAPSPRYITELCRFFATPGVNSISISLESLETFREVLSEDAAKVSPHGMRMGATISTYMLKPREEVFTLL